MSELPETRDVGRHVPGSSWNPADQTVMAPESPLGPRLEHMLACAVSLAASSDVRAIVGAITQHGATVMQADAAVVYLRTMRDGVEGVQLLSEQGVDKAAADQFAWIPLSDAVPVCDAAREGRELFFTDFDTMTAAYPQIATAVHRANRSALAVLPLLAGGERLGSIAFAYDMSRDFGKEDRALGSVIAQQCAEALVRARLYALESSARERAARLLELSNRLAHVTTIHDAAQATIVAISEAFGANVGALYHADVGGGLRCVAARGIPHHEHEAHAHVDIDAHVPVAVAFRTGAPLVFETEQQLKECFPELTESWTSPEMRAIAVQPFTLDGRVVGALSYAFATPHEFTPEELAFTQTVAQQAAVALERVRLIESERSARKSAEELSTAKGMFLATLAHEMRTPLQAIGLQVEVLQAGLLGPVTAAMQPALERISNAERNLLTQINTVLELSRLEARRFEFSLEPVDVVAVAHDAVMLVEPQRLARGVEITPPSLDAPVLALADAARLRQVMVNLLANAIKFTPAGGRITISTTSAMDAGWVEIAVTDTGVGIAREELARIFEPFTQVTGEHSIRQAGSGLGLAISRDFTEGMGGRIAVRSRVGIGTTFTVSLPRAEASP